MYSSILSKQTKPVKSAFYGSFNPLVRFAVELAESKMKSWPESERFAIAVSRISTWSVPSAKSALFDISFGVTPGFDSCERLCANKILSCFEA